VEVPEPGSTYYSIQAAPHGQVREVWYDSKETGTWRHALVYTPPGYDDQTKRYEVPVHADIPHQDVVFLDEIDPIASPIKAKGVGELGICGVGAAIANAICNATGVHVRDYPITLDKLLDRLPEMG
jgi:hypothetical protein